MLMDGRVVPIPAAERQQALEIRGSSSVTATPPSLVSADASQAPELFSWRKHGATLDTSGQPRAQGAAGAWTQAGKRAQRLTAEAEAAHRGSSSLGGEGTTAWRARRGVIIACSAYAITAQYVLQRLLVSI